MVSCLLIPPLIQADHHRYHGRHIHPRRDCDSVALPIRQQLPRTPQLAIYLRHYLPVPLICDLRLHIEEATVHEEVLLLVVHCIDEWPPVLEPADVEFVFDLEDLVAGWGLGKVGLEKGEDFFAQGEEMVASGVMDALAGRQGERIGGNLEHIAAVKRLHYEGVVG